MFHLLLDWSETSRLSGLVRVCFCLLCVFGSWPFVLTSLSNNDKFSTAQWLPSCNDARSIVKKNWSGGTHQSEGGSYLWILTSLPVVYVTPFMPLPRTAILEYQQTGCSSFQSHIDNQSQYPPRDIEHNEFCRDMNGAPLSHDSEERKNFGRQGTFIQGDPAASFDRPCGHAHTRKYNNPYKEFPVWKKIFVHILGTCGHLQDYETIYVLVDTRNLADHKTRNPGLPHWPDAVAWWESALQMTGPMGERTELCFFQPQKPRDWQRSTPPRLVLLS